MSFNELSPRKQSFLREVFDPSLTKEQRQGVLERSGYGEFVGVDGIQSVIDGMMRGVAEVKTPVVPGWVTPTLTDMLNATPDSLASLYKLNKLVELTTDDQRAITSLYPKDGVIGDLDELDRRRSNLIHPVFDGGKVVGINKLFDGYGLDLAQAERLGTFALNCWRDEKYPRRDFTVNHQGDTYAVSIDENGVSIGCQWLARPDVVRVCALMGWGMDKQEGPDMPATTRVKEPA